MESKRRIDYAKFTMIYRVSITKLDNEHLKMEPFIPFLEKVSSAIDGALLELVPRRTMCDPSWTGSGVPDLAVVFRQGRSVAP